MFPKFTGMGSLAIVAGCSGDLSALDPAGPSAASIATLWWVMLAVAAVLFLLVVGLFLATVFVPHFGRRVTQGQWIIYGGIALPLPLLVLLTFFAFWQGEYLLRGAGPPPDDIYRVEAHGTMWSWQFSYPDAPGKAPTQDVLHIPAARTVEIAVTSGDVIHSFWIPRLGGKIDAVPGHVNYLRLRADHPGRYGGVCSEYCGTGHAGMRFEVEAFEDAASAAVSESEEWK
ncbi:cytochrome c oxidase subunit II [Rhizobium sp. NTR19]|uniref:cytochrome-c oxidase n=1 Tax=Neorhizobium turbinariae TaxID=2937795 RepID=A0ABT0IQ23_9HYPH|nr:cytochrome c oxidase subunit II [Neorhizobium turbinariae]MCK8779958.1 cytochrome c oxidase subunit II [Neorhizobium turbinariae]